MDRKLKGKISLVTRGSEGIGKVLPTWRVVHSST
jgi:hypothetical protein